jgi:hypothetical protein
VFVLPHGRTFALEVQAPCEVWQAATEGYFSKIRYLDKLVDELAKGKAMEKILRKAATEEDPG